VRDAGSASLGCEASLRVCGSSSRCIAVALRVPRSAAFEGGNSAARVSIRSPTRDGADRAIDPASPGCPFGDGASGCGSARSRDASGGRESPS
jgi:hypothetical protein